MKTKIIFITFLTITLFIILNYKIFLGNYYFLEANNNYIINNFTGALDGYSKTLEYIKGQKIDFNKANTYYKIGENKDDINEKISNYKTSLLLYGNILKYDKEINKQEDEDVRYNYEFVKKKLEDLKAEDEKKEEEQSKQEEEKQEEQEQEEQQEKQEQGNETNQEDGDKEGESEVSREEQEQEVKLSEQQLEQIEDYVEQLKDEEKYNREFFNNIKPVSDNPFFDNVFDRGGEKDW